MTTLEKDIRKYEAVAVEPPRVLWVELHELIEEDVRGRGQAHGGTRMAGVGIVCSIDLERGLMSEGQAAWIFDTSECVAGDEESRGADLRQAPGRY